MPGAQLRHDDRPDERDIATALRHAGAQFDFIHGSRATGERARSDSDLDVAARWADEAPQSWEVIVPAGVDLVVLNRAPLWLAGRIALEGSRLLFDDDPTARVNWQADTRRICLTNAHRSSKASVNSGRQWPNVVDEERVTRLASDVRRDVTRLPERFTNRAALRNDHVHFR
jgi:uncharacterized protein